MNAKNNMVGGWDFLKSIRDNKQFIYAYQIKAFSLQARLERVFGCTACSRSLAVDPQSGLLAYPAGSAVVLLNPRNQSQAHLVNPGKCQLTCLAWSPCGRFIATGEFGAEPKARVWELRLEEGGKGELKVGVGFGELRIKFSLKFRANWVGTNWASAVW